MPNAWLLLAVGTDRRYSGNTGYADDPATTYRYDSLVQNSRRVAEGDRVVLRDRETMLGVAVVQEIISRPGTKTLRRCPTCTTTQFGERRNRRPRFRCKRGHEFDEPVVDTKACDLFEARFGASFVDARGALTLAELRAACPRYTDQVSIQFLDLDRISGALAAAGVALGERAAGIGSPRHANGLGNAYRPATEDFVADERDPFSVDPEAIERGNRGHAATQNALAAFLRDKGIDPRSPAIDEPGYDLGWSLESATFTCEVKSLTESNEEKQLRLGLGQVLRYRHLLGRIHRTVVAVLAVERAPRDEGWAQLCTELGVLLVWPGEFERVMRSEFARAR